ncbi:hypothetical protein [Planomicrobium sp. Y74]|uniref:NACHT domain-containing protein n=1 Tax=Planomicrobium sp. Y74 TaxID=2478977 RepID=UPI000EF46C2B|nr:hypothetical protein [Planomicrobium sp. Y74]RLQ91337.1 hypothetical protein D9754_06300 [Planomicrobium sp. Y74]
MEKDLTLKKKKIDEEKKLIQAKCISRLKANGLNNEQAKYILENKGHNFEYLMPTKEKRLIVVVGEFGIGKSFAVNKINLSLLLRAERDIDFPIPITLNASQLSADIQNYLETLILDNSKEYWIIVDGMDEVALSLSTNILENMRIAIERWDNLYVILTSRPLIIFNEISEKVFIKGLSEKESQELVNNINTGAQLQNINFYNLPKEIRDVSRRPLFAILLGIYFNRKSNKLPSTKGELLTFFIENALEKIKVREYETKKLLMKLAVESTNNGNIPVKKTEIGDYEDTKNLLNSEIVIEENGYLTFVLPIISQWFAAKALSESMITVDEIISKNSLDYWKYPLVILLSMFNENKFNEILCVIVEKDAGFASILVEESTEKWGGNKDLKLLTSQETVLKIRMSMNYWTKSLGNLANIIAPVDIYGKLLPLGLEKKDGWIETAWYRGNETKPDIVFFDNHKYEPGWGIYRSSNPGDGASWYWRWTLDELKDNLTKQIKNRSLPICTEIIYKELMWCTSLKITNRGSLFNEKIDAKQVRSILDHKYQHAEFIRVDKNLVPKSMYIEYLDELESGGIQLIECPLLGPDIEEPTDNWVWSSYTDERLYSRTLQIYQEVIIGYKEVVETFFPFLKKRLEKYILYPFILKGEFEVPEKFPARSVGPGLKWYLEPLPFDSKEFVIDIKMTKRNKKNNNDNILYELDQIIKKHRPDSSSWLGASHNGQVLDIFGSSPVTNIIYEWLERDLAKINWIQ